VQAGVCESAGVARGPRDRRVKSIDRIAGRRRASTVPGCRVSWSLNGENGKELVIVVRFSRLAPSRFRDSKAQSRERRLKQGDFH
jgi:hypothetical protein